MGIKNLMVIIKKYAMDSIKYKKITDYQSNIFAIDANLLIYKIIYAIRKNGYDLQNDNIIVTHIHSLLVKLIGFLKYDINAVFVFDGTAPEFKSETLKKRKEFQDLMEKKYYSATSKDDKKKYYFMKSKIKLQEILECKKLIELLGFPTFEAPEEADGQLSEFYLEKKVDSIVSDDLDILLFGGGKLLKNFTIDIKKKIQEIDLDILLDKLNFTLEQLIDLGILLGCDYCPTIKGVGTIGAYNLIKEYGSLENIINEGAIPIKFDYKTIQNYFLNPPVSDVSQFNVKRKKINIKGLEKFLIDLKFKESYILNILNKVEKFD